jgi:hypothetical protein
MPKLSDRLAAARAAMTSDRAYRGTGVSGPRGPSRDQQRLGRRRFSAPQRGGSFSDVATGKRSGSPRATDFRTSGAFGRGIGNIANKFVPPIARMMKGVGDLASGAMRGSRLHKAYKDEYGDSRQWEKDKKRMVPSWGLKSGDAGYEGSDKQFYDKYMNLADMAQDNEKKQYYLDQAETAWRNKQTSDRLAAYTGFEDYLPSKYTGTGEGSRYTGSHRDAGQYVPGVEIMGDIITRLGGQGPGATTGRSVGAVGGPIPEDDSVSIDITEDLYGGYPGPEDDVLWGEPGTQSIRPKIKPKPDRWRNVPEHGIPGRPDLSPPDPFGGMYESPLTDEYWSEELIDATPQRPSHSKHIWRPRDTIGIESLGGGMNALPLGGMPTSISPDYGNPEYFEQYYPNITVEFGEEEETGYNPPWNTALGKRGFGG